MSEQRTTIDVNVPGARYHVHVKPGLLAEVGEAIRALSTSKKAAVVTDANVGPLHAPRLEESLTAAVFETIVATIPAGEDHKNLSGIAAIYDQLLRTGMERDTPILALGGGVIGDMAGFVAATILHGVPFVQVPTTLLSMVDASVGGKTGINHAIGKNLIGAFHQPLAVFADVNLLSTLPEREFRNGLAECIKHDVIRDAEAFADLERRIGSARGGDAGWLAELVAHNVRIKAQVVAADPFERGERAHLNFGHTFGHAIENLSKFSYSHGEAIALGMVAASQLAVDLDMLDSKSLERIKRVIERGGLPARGISMDPDSVVQSMFYDKKVKNGRVRLVLPDRIGHVVIRDDVSAEAVKRALRSIQG